MVTSLIYHERIMTTTARAKELRRVAEHMITYAKAGEFAIPHFNTPSCVLNRRIILSNGLIVCSLMNDVVAHDRRLAQ